MGDTGTAVLRLVVGARAPAAYRELWTTAGTTKGTDVSAPRVIVFDVNETLSDLGPMSGRFVDVGLPAGLATTWFAQVLRDGFALAAAGSSAPFATIADGVLRSTFAHHPPNRDPDAAVAHVLEGFTSLNVHPDVSDGVRTLHGNGFRLVTLSNGAATVGESLLGTAGIRDEFEALLTVEDAGRWKPAPQAYAYAAQECGVTPAEMMLVAVHPWDIDGAARAGLQTAWINRTGSGAYPTYLTAPDLTASGVDDLARTLGTR